LGWLQNSGAVTLASIVASSDLFLETSKIAPHSLGLLAERGVLFFQVFDYHQYDFNRRDAEDAEKKRGEI
jgi:hypothetical protein